MTEFLRNRVKEWRQRRGLKAGELAKAIGGSPAEISLLESDDPEKARGLSQAKGIEIARALKCQPGDLQPIITDGSVPIERRLETYEMAVMVGVLTKFLEIHTDYGPESSERLAMAFYKMLLMTLDDVKNVPSFDLQAILDRLDPDQNTSAIEGS